MATMVETCSNCDLGIGNLETPYLWNGSVVCQSCHQRLSQIATPAPVAAPTSIPYATPAKYAAAPAPRQQAYYAHAKGPHIICTNANCGYTGKSVTRSKGSVFIMVFLLFLAVIPGLLYAILMSGIIISCPHCGVRVREDRSIFS